MGYCGLTQPYDFGRAIPVLLVFLGASTLALLAMLSLTFGKLHWGTLRAYFFLYSLVLFFLSLVFLRKKWVSFAFLTIAILELSLALLSVFIAKTTTIALPALFPADEKPGIEVRFKYHPLLMAVPQENFVSTSGIDVRHNSNGQRGPEIGQLALDAKLISVYGGSTTYDVGVPNGFTWPEILEKNLSGNWKVLNFGVPGYSTAEHVIQTAFYQNSLDLDPKCALYYIGWNDIRNAHLPDLDPGYADFHLLSQLENLQVRRNSASFSAIYTVIAAVLRKGFDIVPYPPNYRSLASVEGTDASLESIFKRNIKSLVQINKGRGVRTVFIGQVLNTAQLQGDKSYGWLPRVRDKDVWPLQDHFNTLLRQEARHLGVDSIILNVDDFKNSDFVDNGHFSISGSQKFANTIAPEIKRICR